MRLKDVVIIQGGYAFKSSDFSDSGIPIIRIGNISGEIVNIDKDVCYPEKFWDDHPEFRIENDDILVAMSGATVGKVGLFAYSGKALLNQRVCNIKPDEKKIRKKFLYFYCMSHAFKENIQKNAFGCAQPNISAKQIGEFEIDVPTLTEQDYYSEILSKVKNVIDLYGLELKYLEGLIKSRFVEMFGDPVSNSCHLPEATLPELGEFGRGVSKHRPRNAPELLGGSYPLIQTGEVASADLYITSYANTYSEIGFQQSKMWDKGTLCITIAANIAKTAILGFDACFPDSVVGFNANEKANNIFIHYWFSFFQTILEAQAPESAQKNINLKILSELKVIVPPMDKQNEFATFVYQVDKLKSATQKSLDETQQLFDSLMQKYFG